MKNILLVFTGGTIGSTVAEGIINTSSETQFKLIQQFQQRYKNNHQINFKTIQPLQVLSENLAPAAWESLITAIEMEVTDHIDAIIVTHGTDTLAFTSAALSFYFNQCKQPILLVSSDHPLDNPKANGLDNFLCAIEFIEQINREGVFVPYQNCQQTMQVHLGTWLSSSLQLSGDFYSVQNKSYLEFADGRFSEINKLPQINSKYSLKARFDKRILLIKPYPGLDYSCFDLSAVDIVLHDLYHSGTACTSEQWARNFSLVQFIMQCQDKQIDVYLAPAIKTKKVYNSTRKLMDIGASIIWNMSIECAYVKLLLAYGNFDDEKTRAEFIEADIAGEHIGNA
jgi:L-asparaginase/Glu-tRNA(Gln) amidotransferase subunit D